LTKPCLLLADAPKIKSFKLILLQIISIIEN